MNQLADAFDGFVKFMRPWPGILTFDLSRYLIAAALVTGILLLVTRSFRQRRTVRLREPAPGQRRREFAYSITAVLVFSAVGLGVHYGAENGIFDIYAGIESRGWIYWGFSLVLVVIAHDGYFYWTHRLMHLQRAFPWTHRAHHRSVAPTQWAAYAFAPGEAFVQAAFLPIFVLFVPLHPTVIVIWIGHQVLRNVFGHCGYELMPRQWIATWWGRWLTTTLHHDLHHAHGKGNYGLYFTWWDRWCGTEREDYRPRLAKLIDGMGASSRAEGVIT